MSEWCMSIKDDFLQGVREGRQQAILYDKKQQFIFFVVTSVALLLFAVVIAWAIFLITA